MKRSILNTGVGLLAALALAAVAVAGHHETAPHSERDVVDTAVAAGEFKTLAKALEVAGLIGTLKGEGPFTVFAPNDAAFAKIDPKELDALLADRERLTAVLTYHVVAGRVTAADVATLDSATSLQGGRIEIGHNDGVQVDGAEVIQADVEASNGVIHVIDRVIFPSS